MTEDAPQGADETSVPLSQDAESTTEQQRLDRALTDLHTYAMLLDAQRERLVAQARLAGGSAVAASAIDEEVAALRGVTRALQRSVDPPATSR